MKKTISLLLVMLMLFSLCSCAKPSMTNETATNPTVKETPIQPSATPEVTSYDKIELQRAVEYGIVPQDIAQDTSANVTNAEFCAMLTNLITKAMPDKLPEWNTTANKALRSDEVMQRDDAAVALLYAAQVMSLLYTNVSVYPEIKKVETSPDFHKYSNDYPLWPAMQEDIHIHTILPGTPDEYENGSWGSVISNAACFVIMKQSLVNEKPLLSWDDNFKMRFTDNITRGEAIAAVVRLGESEANLLDENHYLSIEDVGAFDSTIITTELLSKPSTLPEPTQSVLPASWKGVGSSARKDGRHFYKDFQESDIAFLAENGFNFMRVFFGFSTLRFPDYPADEKQVNQSEFEDLDRLIAWGIQYDVHIQLSMICTPNGSESFDIEDDEWEMTYSYWIALARRYATIPSRYLSFDLVNEISPHEQSNFDRVVSWMERINSDIHTISPQRVTLVSHPGLPDMKWAEAMAKAGIAIGCHPYLPTYLVDGNNSHLYASAESYWPYPYFPQILERGESVTISGDIGGNSLLIDFWVYEPFTIVFSDGQKQTIRKKADYKDEMSCGWRFNEPLSIPIPAGVTSLSIQTVENPVSFCELGLTDQSSKLRWLVPHDYFEGTATGSANLIWSNERGWSSDKNCTIEEVFAKKIQPMLDLASQYNVGVMCNEFGMFATNMRNWKIDIIAQYTDDMLRIFEEHNIPWCLCEEEGFPYRFLTMPYATDVTYEWVGATLTQRTYTFPDGHERKIYVCEDLLNVFLKYLPKKTDG